MRSFSTKEVCELVGLQGRLQLDKWESAGFLRADVLPSAGTGRPRRYSFNSIVAAVIARSYTERGTRAHYLRNLVACIQAAPDILEYDGELWLVVTDEALEWYRCYPNESPAELAALRSWRINLSAHRALILERMATLEIVGEEVPPEALARDRSWIEFIVVPEPRLGK